MQIIKSIVRSGLLVGLALTFFATSQASAAGAWVLSYNYKKLNGTHLVSGAITQDAGDSLYAFTERPNNVKVTAPQTNTGGNTRQLFWPANGPDVMDAQTCATWSKQVNADGVDDPGITQQGAALRITQTPEGATRGITVTKNIWYGATWIFNVHTMDSSNQAQPYAQLAGFDMSEVVGKMWWQDNADGTRTFQSNLKPLPWRLCARTVGTRLQFKVWTDELVQPSWNDPKYVREVQIPAEWNQPGKAGWYIGHLKPGYTAVFQGLSTHYRAL